MGLAKKGLDRQEDEEELQSVEALQEDVNQSDLSSVGSEFDESSDEEDGADGEIDMHEADLDYLGSDEAMIAVGIGPGFPSLFDETSQAQEAANASFEQELEDTLYLVSDQSTINTDLSPLGLSFNAVTSQVNEKHSDENENDLEITDKGWQRQEEEEEEDEDFPSIMELRDVDSDECSLCRVGSALFDGTSMEEGLESPGRTEGDKDSSNEEEQKEPEEDEDDELVKAIKAAKEIQRDHPPDIQTEDCIVDLCFHPVHDILAVGSITGDVYIYNYSNDENQLMATHELHSKACRDIEFSEDGNTLFSCSKDKSIMLTDMDTGKLKGLYENAHDDPIYCLRVISENLIATGDDEGTVRMWDTREKHTVPIFSLKVSEDYISDMITNSAAKYLVCTGGDGGLSTINMSGRKIHVQSNEYESELTCLGLLRNDTKIFVGSSKGKMYLFNWGEFGLHSDEYAGPKQSISCMVPITENIVVMSGEDGILRATHLFPHKHLGIVGQHSISVERMDICNAGTYIASTSHNNDIKFWNISYFNDMEVSTANKKQNKRKDLRNNLPSSKARNASDFFSGMT